MITRQELKNYIDAAKRGAIKGIRETPREYFAPLINLFRWWSQISKKCVVSSNSRLMISSKASAQLQNASEHLGVPPTVVLELAIEKMDAEFDSSMNRRRRTRRREAR